MSVWLVGLNPDVLSVIQRSSLGKVLGRERMHFNLELAVRIYGSFCKRECGVISAARIEHSGR